MQTLATTQTKFIHAPHIFTETAHIVYTDVLSLHAGGIKVPECAGFLPGLLSVQIPGISFFINDQLFMNSNIQVS